VPATFKQPDDPPSGVQIVESPAADKFEVRFVTRGTSRSSNDYAAYRIAAEVLKARLRAAKPTVDKSLINVKSFDHLLPGTFVIRFSGTKELAGLKSEADDLVQKAFSAPVSDAEFQPAKEAEVNEFGRRDVYDQWLDMDTYKTEVPAKLQARWAATTLGDVQNVMSRIKGQPMSVVIVSSAGPAQ
jgi:hypothetical protein